MIVSPMTTLLLILATSTIDAVPGEHWTQLLDVRDGGFDPTRLEAAHARADSLGSAAVLVVRAGQVVAAWGPMERRFRCHSIRKSFVGALYGPAVVDGTIDLDATLDDLGIDDRDGLTDLERTASIEHLLSSRSGIRHPAAKEPPTMREERASRVPTRPGESFWYNNWDFNAAGHLYERLTGRDLFEAFRADIAGPLGMEDLRPSDTFLQVERDRSTIPAHTFRMSTRDAARFGLLFLHHGRWNDREIVPGSWIDRSWTLHTDLGRGHGYGYLWWVYGPGTWGGDATAYAALGAGGHAIVIVPALELVVVHRCDTDFTAGVPDRTMWEVVAAIADAIVGEPVADAAVGPVVARPFSRPLPPLRIPDTRELPPSALDPLEGRYVISDRMALEVERLDGFLVASLTGLGDADFRAVTETEFYAPSIGATLSFELDPGGGPSRVTVRFRGRELVGTRSATGAPPPIDPAGAPGR